MTGRLPHTLLSGLFLAACGADSAPPVGPTEPDSVDVVATVQVRPHQLYLDELGSAVRITALAYDDRGGLLYRSTDRPERFSWSSSAAAVATVDSSGWVIGQGWGIAIVTASHVDGPEVSTRVRVDDAVHLAWSTWVGTGSIQSGVAVGPDGALHVVSSVSGGPSVLHALSPQGDVLWSQPVPRTGAMTPAFGNDGTLYVASMDGQLLAVAPGGGVRWTLEGLDPVRSSPAVGSDGLVHVAGGRYVHAVDPQGSIRWTYENPSHVFTFSSPAVDGEGTVYVGASDRQLYSVRPDGSVGWTFRTGGVIHSSPAIGSNGVIYFGSEDGRLYALNADGVEQWSLLLDAGGVLASPSIGPDGVIYVMAGSLFAVDPGGSIRWSYPAGSHGFQPTPVVGADGTVYFASFRGITALDAEGNLLWTHAMDEAILGSPAIGVDGAILWTSFLVQSPNIREGSVHALTETSSANGGFDGAPWPTARGNRANNGRAGT